MADRLSRGASIWIPVLVTVMAVAAATVLALAFPATAFGATPYPPPSTPEPTPLDALLGVVQTLLPLLILVVGLGIVYGAARLVAAIGRASDISRPESGEIRPLSNHPGSVPLGMLARLGMLVTGVVAVAGGVLYGRWIAYVSSSLSAPWASISVAEGATAAGIIAVALAMIGVLALRKRHGQATAAIRAVLLSAGLLVVGVGGGAATAGLTGGLYREPVEAAAVVQLTLSPTQPAFTPRTDGEALCRSIANSQEVAVIDGYVGELGPVRLGVQIDLQTDEPLGGPRVQLMLDPTGPTEAIEFPSWEGPARLQLSDPLGMAGSAAFEARVQPSSGPKDIPTAAPPGGTWPALLAGQLTWTCAQWAPSAGQ